MNLEVKIEIRSIVKKAASQLPDGSTHNFTVLVQGLNGNKIEHFVNQVVFYLPSNHKVQKNPPYIISGSARSSFRLPIEIYLKTSEARNKVKYSYYVHLPNKPVESAVNVKTWTFLNTPLDFRQRLLRGGAEVVKESNSAAVETEVKSEPVEEAAGAEINQSRKSDEHSVFRTEPTEGANTQYETQNESPNTSVQTKDMSEQNGTLLIQDIYSFDELMKENEVLKKENEELFQKFTHHEGVISTYIEKLPALQNDLSAKSTELSQLQKKSEDIEAEISSLKSAIQTLKYERLPPNEIDEIKRQRKRRKKTSVESSSSALISSENESNSKNSHKVLSKDKEMATTQKNVDTISHAVFDSPTLNAESNLIQDACKSLLKSGCDTSKNNSSSSFSHLNVSVNAHGTVQNTAISERIFDASCNETAVENSDNLSVQNESSSFNPRNNDSSTCSSEKESSKNIFSHCSNTQKAMCSVPPAGLAVKRPTVDEPVKSSLDKVTVGESTSPSIVVEGENSSPERPRKRLRTKPRFKDKSGTNSFGSISKDIDDGLVSENMTSSNGESVRVVSSSLQTEPVKYLSTKETQEQVTGDFIHFENPSLDSRTTFLAVPEDINQNLGSAEQKIVSSVPHAAPENSSDPGEQSTIHEQASSRVECSLSAVTIGDNTSPSIAVENNIKRKNKKPFKRRKKPKLKYFTWLRSQTHSKKSVSKDIDNRPISENMTSNCENAPAVNSSVQTESNKCLSMEKIQEHAKSGLQVDLNQQKKDPVVADFLHLENPTLDKITIFLPIPEDLKQNLCSANERIVSSVPLTDLVNNSDSGKDSTIREQACSPAENSFDTVAISDNTSSSTAVESKNSEPQDQKPLKRKKEKRKGFKRRKSESESFDSITPVLKEIDDRLISEAKRNYYAHLLVKLLERPRKRPDVSTTIFRVIDHLRNTTKNYLEAFRNDRENCIFLPSSESCIVSSLFEIEKKHETSQWKLIENILITTRHLIMSSRKSSNVDGLASLCRVFTEICRRKKYPTRPLSLCADILKMRILRAPYLIASMAGVWREPFMLPSDQSEEAMILLGSISLAVGKKLQGRNKKRYSTADDETWSYSVELITEYFGFPSLPDIDAAVNFLKNSIISNCTQNLSSKLWMVTSAFVILASYQRWKWTKEHLMEEFIKPNLSKFANEEPNETAFALFCDLFVEVHILYCQMSIEVLKKYFTQESNEGSSFVREWAAVSLAKLCILRKQQMSGELKRWINANKDKSSVETIEGLILRMKMYQKGLNSAKEIVIT